MLAVEVPHQTMHGLVIRPALPGDIPALLAIYAPYVAHTPATFEEEPPTIDEFAERVRVAQTRWSWLVAETGGALVGYAYGGAHRPRAAYRWTVETSAYVAEASRGQGVGTALYRALLPDLAAQGYCNAYAGITLPNDASVRLHRGLGFEEVGVFRRAGWKLGTWHDVSWWQRALRDAPPHA